jgi:hypothetical protein
LFDIAFATDDSGPRGPALQAQPGLRILGLGDSFAMGYGDGQAETYLAQLGRLMEAEGRIPGRRPQGIGAGNGDWSAVHVGLVSRTGYCG